MLRPLALSPLLRATVGRVAANGAPANQRAGNEQEEREDHERVSPAPRRAQGDEQDPPRQPVHSRRFGRRGVGTADDARWVMGWREHTAASLELGRSSPQLLQSCHSLSSTSGSRGPSPWLGGGIRTAQPAARAASCSPSPCSDQRMQRNPSVSRIDASAIAVCDSLDSECPSGSKRAPGQRRHD